MNFTNIPGFGADKYPWTRAHARANANTYFVTVSPVIVIIRCVNER